MESETLMIACFPCGSKWRSCFLSGIDLPFLDASVAGFLAENPLISQLLNEDGLDERFLPSVYEGHLRATC